MAQMVKPSRTRKSSGKRSHTLARHAIVSDLLKTPKSKREPFQFTDGEGNVVEDLGSGVLLDPSTLNSDDIGAPRPLTPNSVRTMVYNVAKDQGLTVSIHEWTDGNLAVVVK